MVRFTGFETLYCYRADFCMVFLLRLLLQFCSGFQIRNDLSFSVQVHYRGVSQVESCGVITPGSSTSLPLIAVYALYGDLFFTPVGDRSVQLGGFLWRFFTYFCIYIYFVRIYLIIFFHCMQRLSRMVALAIYSTISNEKVNNYMKFNLNFVRN